jgi:hypothetical protein
MSYLLSVTLFHGVFVVRHAILRCIRHLSRYFTDDEFASSELAKDYKLEPEPHSLSFSEPEPQRDEGLQH